MSDAAFLRCISTECGVTDDLASTNFKCRHCGSLQDVAYDWNRLLVPRSIKDIGLHRLNNRPASESGVWRFYSMLPFTDSDNIVSIGEGQTILQQADRLADYVDLAPQCLYLQYEGLNPSGSFKDNGMTAAFSHARRVGARRAACASTGNTSSSLAMYCAATGAMHAIVFVGSGRISMAKLAQALDYGALTLEVQGDFDDAMRQVQIVSRQHGIYLVNSINPFRLEGQKTIMFRVLQALDWESPDWIVLPGGNLGNTASFGKAFSELKELGLLSNLPRLAVINAAGADSFYQLYERRKLRWNHQLVDWSKVSEYYQQMDRDGRRASTVASAIEINRPVNLPKALRSLSVCDGVVRSVTDQDILDAKARVGRGGFGCEPASAASVAGLKKLRAEGVIGRTDRVVCILTGHALKDADVTVAYHSSETDQVSDVLRQKGVSAAAYSNRPIPVANDESAIIAAIEAHS